MILYHQKNIYIYRKVSIEDKDIISVLEKKRKMSTDNRCKGIEQYYKKRAKSGPDPW